MTIVAALAALVGGAAVVVSRGTPVTTALVARRDLDRRIVASGRVLSPSRASVSATTQGLALAVGAAFGQHVNAGDLLVQLDDREARAALAQATAEVEQARARADQLRSVGVIVASQAVAQAASNLAKAKAEFDRATTLAATGAAPEVEVETALRALEVARAQKSAADAQELGTSGADARLALGARLQAEAQRTAAEVRLAQTRVVAAAAGTVLARAVEPGDLVQPGKTLFVLAYDGDAQLVFQADERNLAAIAVGQKAVVSADAFPAETFDAVTYTIAPSIDPQRGTVEVRLRVPQPPRYLRPDMTVSIDLLVASKRQVLVAPSESVRDAATPAPWALVVEGGRARRRALRLGISGEGATEIREGAAEGDEVVITDGRPVAEGRRVRATRRAP